MEGAIVVPEIQGVHGIKPPSLDLAQAAENWINSIMKAQDVAIKCVLEITGWKRLAGKSGIFVRQIREKPFENSLELRIRTKKSPNLLWKCYLFFPDRDKALEILMLARPDAFACLKVFAQSRVVKDDQRPRNLLSREVRRKRSKIFEFKPERIVSQFKRGKNLKYLCWLLWQTYADSPFSAEQIYFSSQKVVQSPVLSDSFILIDLAEILVLAGAIDPIVEESVESNSLLFVATELMKDYATDYEEILRNEKIQSLLTKKANKEKSVTTLRREEERLKRLLVETETAIKNKLQKINEVNEQIEELRSQSLSCGE